MSRELLRSLEQHYNSPRFIKRDKDLESRLILKSKAELCLLTSLKAGIVDIWKGKLYRDGNRFKAWVMLDLDRDRPPFMVANSNENFLFVEVEVAITPEPIKDPGPQLGGAGKSERVALGSMRVSGMRHFCRDHLVHAPPLTTPPLSFTLREMNEDSAFVRNNKTLIEYLYLGIYDFFIRKGPPPGDWTEYEKNAKNKWETFRPVCLTNIVQTPLIQLLCLAKSPSNPNNPESPFEFESEEEAVSYVANHHQLSEDPFNEGGWLDGRRGWRQCRNLGALPNHFVPCAGTSVQIWQCKNAKGYSSEAVTIDLSNRTVLPLTAWETPRTECRYYLNIPSPNPLLFNGDKVAENPEAVVFLTDSIEVAYHNDDRFEDGSIWASWYGGERAVERIDWRQLRSRKVCYVIAEHPEISMKESYSVAYAVYKQLSNVRGVDFHFCECRTISEGQGSPVLHFRHFSEDEFNTSARAILGIDEIVDEADFLPQTMKQLVKDPTPPRDYLLEPLLLERSSTLMYAMTNVGKTWLALCIGSMVARGSGMLGHWQAPKPRKVLYVDSEMDRSSMVARVKKVAAMAFNGKVATERCQENFLLISRKRSKKGNDEFMKRILDFVKKRKIALVILDNLTAFTNHNDSAKAWEDIHSWVDRLWEADCATLFVHHANKAGDQRGTSATTNAVDNVLHVSALGIREIHELLVTANQGGNKRDDIASDLRKVLIANPGLKMRIAVEKGRDIWGEARNSLYVSINPNTAPPTCQLIPEIMPEPEENLYLKTADKKAIKEESKQKFNNDVFAMLNDGTSIANIAAQLKVSAQKIYQIPGIKEHPSYINYVAKSREDKAETKKSILQAMQSNEAPHKVAAEHGKSFSTVNRIRENHLITEIKSLKLKTAKAIADALKISEKMACRLLQAIKLEMVPKLHQDGLSPEEIASKLGVDQKRVERIVEKIVSMRQKMEQNKAEEQRVQQMFAEGHQEDDIKKATTLPANTVARIINQKRIDQAVAEGLKPGEIAERTGIALSTVEKRVRALRIAKWN